MQIYLDNAATTAPSKEVVEAMLPYLTTYYGNPSSQHEAGRKVRSAIEESRKKIASYIHAKPGDIVFTSGGTESNNTILKGCVRDLGVKRIIISAIEHHGILHTAEYLRDKEHVELVILPVNRLGQVDLELLENYLSSSLVKTLVSIMHANNEIGVMIHLNQVAQLCKKYQALFHSDTVQSFAHFKIDVEETLVDFISVAAHKFHGPKGVGFFYMSKSAKIHSFIQGGSQERGMRAGTENVPGIIGMTHAIELAYDNLEEDSVYILGLKRYLIDRIKRDFPDIYFNGTLADSESLYTVLSLSLPYTDAGSLLLFELDMRGICVSGGSACSSGASVGSHVIAALQGEQRRIPLRVSFSKYNTREEIDTFLQVLKELYH